MEETFRTMSLIVRGDKRCEVQLMHGRSNASRLCNQTSHKGIVSDGIIVDN